MKFIVIGAGEVGDSLSAKLVQEEHDVVLVDQNESQLTRAAHSLDLQTVCGNGSSAATLIKAGLTDTDYVIAVTNSDEVNVTACLTSKMINPSAKRIARLRYLDYKQNPLINEKLADYFDLVVSPDIAAANQVLQFFKLPGARDVFELADGQLQVIGISLGPRSPLTKKRLQNVQQSWQEFSCLLLAVERKGKLFVPRGKDKLLEDDTIYAVTHPDSTAKLFKAADKELLGRDNIMIWGGSAMGRHVAHTLEDRAKNLKLILSDKQDAVHMADEFDTVLVLHGDGTDQALLQEEGIKTVDIFVAASAQEENNILASLLAKRLGAKLVIALVNKAEYLPLVSAIGVDVVISSRVAAGTAIFNNIFARSAVSEFSLRHKGAGFINITVDPTLNLAGRALKETNFPAGILIAAILRDGQALIPNGESVIKSGDQIIIFVVRSALKHLEHMLHMKLDLFT